MPLFKVIINNRPKAKLVNICVCSDLSYQIYWYLCTFHANLTYFYQHFYSGIFIQTKFQDNIINIPSTILCISREEKLVKGKKFFCSVLFLTSPLKKVQKTIFQRIEPSTTRYSKVH